MNVNKLIINTLSPLKIPISQDVYEGEEERYLVFIYEDDRANKYQDNKPVAEIAYLQVHFFAPINFNYVSTQRKIRNLLFDAGFSYPNISIFLEKQTKRRHLVFNTYIETQTELEREE